MNAQSAQKPAARSSGERVTLDFANADIEAVARTIATITGRNVVVDPRVKGTVSLSSDKPVTPAVAFNQFLAALRLQGFTMVENSGLYKVVPEADGKIQSGTVTFGGTDSNRLVGNQIATQIFRLNFESANNLVPILRPLISPNNTINVNPGNNSLVITDYAENLRRIGTIIASMDVANATDLEIIPLRYAIASDLAPLVLRLMESGGGGVAAGGQPDSSFRTTIAAETRSNALIVRAANPARVAMVRSLVARLDQPTSSSPTGNIYVVYLKNADATKLAATLRATITGQSSGGGGGGALSVSAPTAPSTPSTSGLSGGLGVSSTSSSSSSGGGASFSSGASSSAATTGGQIQADTALNALIITASEPQYRQLRAVIDKLDGRRAQVYLESIIVEVNTNKMAQFGVQLQTLLGNRGASALGAIGSNFGSGAANIIGFQTGVASGSVSLPPGLNLGVANRQSGGAYVLNALANFLESTGSGNVLSTPNLLTLDNEEAKIVVGQNVPFVSGSFTNTGGAGGAVNPFQTVERKDVGLTLRVKPQISEDGTVKLQIFQEISSVDPTSVNSLTGLITNKRSIESNVVVDDGSIVVLGGLLTDEYSGQVQQVPLLGNVPVIGNLFKNQNRARTKNNLIMFLRPVVVRDEASTEKLSLDRYDYIRREQILAQPLKSTVLPVNQGALLPLRPSQKLLDDLNKK